MLFQRGARPDPGQQQQLRRIDRAAGQDDFAPRLQFHRLAGVVAVGHTYRALTLKQNSTGQRAGDDGQVRARARRMQIGPGATAPPAILLRQLVEPDAFLFGTIEIVADLQ